MANKYLALKGEKFDISKVTVVGNPTITSDGVASGFSDSNYVNAKVSFNQNNKVRFRISGIYTESTSAQSLFSFFSTRLELASSSCSFRWNNIWIIGTSFSEQIKTGDIVDIDLILNNVGGHKLKVYKNGILIGDAVSNTQAGESDVIMLRVGDYQQLEGFYWQGSIDLNSFKIYVDGELVYSPTKPTYLLERRKPKVWNKGQFTVVGDVAISDDGVASGFSANNYITGNPVNLSTSNWEIKSKFTTGVNANGVVNGKVYALSKDFTSEGRFGIGLGFVQDGKFELTDTNDNATAWGGNALSSILASPNTTYYTKHYFDGKNIKLDISTDGRNYTNIISKIKTNNFVTFKSLEFGSLNKAINFTGSINLKQFKIYTDNTLVFDGGADTYVYDPSKFTMVGSPTITEYGVASNLSQASYFTAPFIDFKDKAFSFKARVKFTDFTGSRNVIFGQRGKDLILPSLCLEGNKLRVYRPTDGTTYDSWNATTFTSQINTWYDVELIMDLSNFIVKINGDEVVKKASSGITFDIGSNVVCLGTTLNITSWKLDGSIDLSQFSITVDGKEVFTGAKENYYMLRR